MVSPNKYQKVGIAIILLGWMIATVSGFILSTAATGLFLLCFGLFIIGVCILMFCDDDF